MNNDKPESKPEERAGKIPLKRLVIRKFGVPWDLCSFSGLCMTCGVVVGKGELYANDMAEHDIWRCKSCLKNNKDCWKNQRENNWSLL